VSYDGVVVWNAGSWDQDSTRLLELPLRIKLTSNTSAFNLH